ncbi:hypothetical protein E3V35_07675 [Streptococcus pseudopneumoniae]|nr:hypothetical protein E3V35_07675 [Streptococcus pseudopneumoniae]
MATFHTLPFLHNFFGLGFFVHN